MAKMFYRLDIKIQEKDYDRLLGLLSLAAGFGWEEISLPAGLTVFRLHCENQDYLRKVRADAAAVCPEAEFAESGFEQEDWLSSWKKFFTPVACGSRFLVLPPWLRDQDSGARQKIIIEPKSAFGTGHHASTALCLGAISDLLDSGGVKPGQSFLDLGCGTGILGMAAAISGLRGLCLDTDPLAIENALENARLNAGVDMEIALGSIEVARGMSFELVIANILAQPLIELAPDIAACVKSGGFLVLSGILDRQARDVEAAYAARGMGKAECMDDGEWRALIMKAG